ncbi:MAG: ThuA domain-containing protein [Alphaproteobacteria bacterium]|nr:ThuA domain-containing protein [Alphaproteobacteria bacterium]
MTTRTRKLFALGALAAALVAGGALAQTGNRGGAINDNLGDYDYGVCRGIDARCFHDWPRAKTTQYRVLLFTHTAGPRHADLGPALAAGLNPQLADANVVQAAMLKIAAANGWHLDYTEDVSQMTNLDSYNAVVFFSTSRDNLDDNAKTALRQYMRAGGGFVAIHNAFGTLYNWPYYEGLLGNANYYNHGPERSGDVVLQDTRDASTQGLPRRWKFRDEWYNLIPFPTRVRFLATVDEKSWDPNEARGGGGGGEAGPPPAAAAGAPAADAAGRGGRAGRGPGRGGGGRAPSVVGQMPGHGDFHPVAWCQYYDGGKAWMTTLGHDAGDFADDDAKFPGSVEFVKLITGGIKSVMGQEPFCQ